MTKKIAIMGCGWLGLPLAKTLRDEGNMVNGSSTSKEKLAKLEQEGIRPFLLSLSEDTIEGNIIHFLKNVDVLVVNVPPKLRGDSTENYVKKMQLLHRSMETTAVRKIIFVSSTSVYGDVDGEVTEETIPRPSTESGRQLLASEHIFKEDANLQTTIIRFGGLIGPNRHPVTMLSLRKKLSNGNAPINLIHLHDCIRIISEIIKKNWWQETFNGVYPYHPPKQEYYTSEAKNRGLQVPDYDDDRSTKGKKVHSYRLINVKKFRFTTTL